MKTILIGLSILIGETSGRISGGKCPTVEYIKNFDASSYSGKWYEQVRDRMNVYTLNSDCVTKEFALKSNGDVDLYLRAYYGPLLDYKGINGTMYQCKEGSPTTFTCMATMGSSTERSPFNILDTDYKSYDIVYYCKDLAGMMKSESFAVSSREEHMSHETY